MHQMTKMYLRREVLLKLQYWNKLEKIKMRLENLNLKNIALEFIEWKETMDKEVLKTDIVIFPYLNDH